MKNSETLGKNSPKPAATLNIRKYKTFKIDIDFQ